MNGTYLTEGLKSLETVPDGQVDFLFSQAVLEHIRLADFKNMVKQMRRVLKPTGVASHQIDFKDHLQQGLNHLRFSSQVWESEFMARSGFYTNRLTWPSMQKIFQAAGFSVELRSSTLWPNGLPTPQHKMAYPFKTMPSDDLMMMGAHVLLRPVPAIA